mmetsp:Transcript_46186/g.122425  ORF Transcript_46186/g.122425 Transcript_46186/m.122425 type:complete len:210 (-) Transcript_46186:2346-2975(-)
MSCTRPMFLPARTAQNSQLHHTGLCPATKERILTKQPYAQMALGSRTVGMLPDARWWRLAVRPKMQRSSYHGSQKVLNDSCCCPGHDQRTRELSAKTTCQNAPKECFPTLQTRGMPRCREAVRYSVFPTRDWRGGVLRAQHCSPRENAPCRRARDHPRQCPTSCLPIRCPTTARRNATVVAQKQMRRASANERQLFARQPTPPPLTAPL